MDHPKAVLKWSPTPEESRKLDEQWAASFTEKCEHRSLGLFRRMSLAGKDALFAEAKKLSITSYRPLKALAVELGIVEDYQEPP